MARQTSISHRLYTGEKSFNFIGGRRRWYMLSGILVLLCFVAIFGRGLTLGIEFSGGTDFQAPMTIQEGTLDAVRAELQAADFDDLEPQVFSLGDTTIRVQTRALSTEETTQMRALMAELAGTDVESVTYSAIGPSWGQQVSQQALIALIVFVVLVMILIWAWFRDWRMSLAAIIPLAHDLILTIGIYAAVGFTVTPATMIGVLTILSYSLYDTVVVFDQIRRNTAELDKSSMLYGEVVNKSTNQVLIRSMNTTVIGILPVGALLVAGTMLGTGPLGDLGLAMFVGMLAGAYSSIFLAAPLLVEFNKNAPRIKEHDDLVHEQRELKVRRAAEQAAAAELADATVASGESGAPVAPSVRNPDARRRTTRAERKRR